MEPMSQGFAAAAERPADHATDLPAATIAQQVRDGEVSASEVTAAHLAVIGELDPTIHALVAVDAERALRIAARLDDRRRRGARLGPLAGVPFVVKDNIDVRRQTTSCGSRAHAGALALRTAPAIARLLDAGAVLLARANMDELAMGASTQTSAFGPTRNPHDVRRSPGGSSGGCAAAVAAGLATLAVGTDTGGSIREPAAQCGVVGLAPSPGLVSVRGVVPFAPALDRVGPLARSVADTALVLAVLTGRRPPPRADRRLRVGVVTELVGAPNRPGVLARFEAACALLPALGVDIVPVSVPDARLALAAYMSITSAASVTVLEPYVRTGQAGEEVMRRWELGRTLAAADLDAACAVQARLNAQTQQALRECDALFSPTMPTTAPLLDVLTADELTDPMAAPYTDCWTVIANLTGLPALSLPAGRSPEDGMPVGVMLCGAAGSDATLLELGAGLERALAQAATV